MINKKNVLGKEPPAVGVKDAVHVAIVAVRAGHALNPGDRIGLNSFNEAVRDNKGPGVVDTALKTRVMVGDVFWMLLDQEEVPNVAHHWEHPTVKFEPPTREVVLNQYLARHAARMRVTYKQLMEACAHVMKHGQAAPYPGDGMPDDVNDDLYGVWSEWADETGTEFENNGSECCPEYDYPGKLWREQRATDFRDPPQL